MYIMKGKCKKKEKKKIEGKTKYTNFCTLLSFLSALYYVPPAFLFLSFYINLSSCIYILILLFTLVCLKSKHSKKKRWVSNISAWAYNYVHYDLWSWPDFINLQPPIRPLKVQNVSLLAWHIKNWDLILGARMHPYFVYF